MKFNFILLAVFIAISFSAFSGTNKKDNIQRTPTGVLDMQENTISNFQFKNTNNGMAFFDVSQNLGAGTWPRGSSNQYMFGGGVWFGCQKLVATDSIINNGDGTFDTVTVMKLNKLCSMSYDPNSGSSWMSPGRIEDSLSVTLNDNYKYRIYFSTDFDSEGEPKKPLDRYNWPLWNNGEELPLGMGNYVRDVDLRNKNSYPNGPFYKSDEDIYSTFKDTDLSIYQDSMNIRTKQGYPLGLQYEQTMLTWASEENKDMVILFYKVTNMSKDTLLNCWVAPIYDMDLARISMASEGASNDRVKFYSDDRDLNLGIAWTRGDQGEAGYRFGYLGISFILTPAVDGNSNLLAPADYYDKSNQIGMVTFRNWSIAEDITEDENRFNFLSSGAIDAATIPGDRRMAFSSGPFNMKPGENVYFATQINLAGPALGWDATGESLDMKNLVDKVKQGQAFFYDKVLDKMDDFVISDLDFSIYPNPANDRIYIKHSLKNLVNIRINDVLGKELLNKTMVHSGTPYIELDISNLVTGNYIICLSDNNKLISKKLVVTK